jgi:hypothetical protein
MSKKTKAQTPLPAEIKLDLGCGRNKTAGFTGLDLYAADADIRCDLFNLPWCEAKNTPSHLVRNPLFKDNSVSEIVASHFLEHVPHGIRWRFMEECYRVLKVGGIMRIFVPNWKSERSYGDMTHEWPPVVAMFFFYLNEQWRRDNRLTYGPYDIKANFDHKAGPTQIAPAFAQRSQEAQEFACAFHCESYTDMWVVLEKRERLPLETGK